MCRCAYYLHTCKLFVVVFVVCCVVRCYSQYGRVITTCCNNSLLTISYWKCSLCPSRQVHCASVQYIISKPIQWVRPPYCPQYTIHTQFTIHCAFVLHLAILQTFCALNNSKNYIVTYQQPANLMSLASMSQCQVFKELANFWPFWPMWLQFAFVLAVACFFICCPFLLLLVCWLKL